MQMQRERERDYSILTDTSSGQSDIIMCRNNDLHTGTVEKCDQKKVIFWSDVSLERCEKRPLHVARKTGRSQPHEDHRVWDHVRHG